MMVLKSFLIYINLCELHKLGSFIMVREKICIICFYRNEKYVVLKL